MDFLQRCRELLDRLKRRMLGVGEEEAEGDNIEFEMRSLSSTGSDMEKAEEVLKDVSVDFSDREIQDIQGAVLELLSRVKEKINAMCRFKISRIQPCGSMAEKTAVWKRKILTLSTGKQETLLHTEFDFLAVLVKPTYLKITLNPCQLCAKVAEIRKPYDKTYLGIEHTTPIRFNCAFVNELQSAITALCECYEVDDNRASYDIDCVFKPKSTQTEPGCGKCSIYTQSGHLRISTSIKPEYRYRNTFTLVFIRKSDGITRQAPENNDQNEHIPIMIDFLPAIELFSPQTDKHDCFIVPKRCVQKCDGWRISNCLKEIDHIVNEMSIKHHKCFKILKYFNQPHYLPGYHVKTALLSHSQACTDSNDCYICCLSAVLRDLRIDYERGVLTDFRTKANLINYEFDKNHCLHLTENLTCEIRENIELHIVNR